MTASASPIVRLNRAVESGNLELVRLTAAECGHIPLDVALRILLLIGSQEPSTYERAAVRWLGRLMVERPELGFEEAAAALGDMAGLFGHEHRVAA